MRKLLSLCIAVAFLTMGIAFGEDPDDILPEETGNAPMVETVTPTAAEAPTPISVSEGTIVAKKKKNKKKKAKKAAKKKNKKKKRIA